MRKTVAAGSRVIRPREQYAHAAATLLAPPKSAARADWRWWWREGRGVGVWGCVRTPWACPPVLPPASATRLLRGLRLLVTDIEDHHDRALAAQGGDVLEGQAKVGDRGGVASARGHPRVRVAVAHNGARCPPSRRSRQRRGPAP